MKIEIEVLEIFVLIPHQLVILVITSIQRDKLNSIDAKSTRG